MTGSLPPELEQRCSRCGQVTHVLTATHLFTSGAPALSVWRKLPTAPWWQPLFTRRRRCPKCRRTDWRS